MLALAIFATSCLSEVDNQSDGTQVAVAAAIGLGEPVAGAYQTRSGSDVILSGKDSDSTAAPIFTFAWEQIVGSGDPVVELFERDASSRVFTAPSVATRETLEFRLTTTDVNGRTETDTVMIAVNPISDENVFLRDPRSAEAEHFYLFVVPDVPGPVATTTSYTLTVTPIVTWTRRDGGTETLSLEDILSASDEIETGFVPPIDPEAPGQDRFRIAVPLLDFDEINKSFQGAERAGRLELEEIDNASVELQISLTGVMGSAGLQVFVGRAGGRAEPPVAIIEGDRIYPVSPPTPSLPEDEILSSDRSVVSIDVERLRHELGVESKASAQNYYDCIDPSSQAVTLDSWRIQAGMTDLSDPSIVHARYVNNYDLGFGRDMYVREDGSGNVYSFVVNHPSLESLIKGTGEFATVVMEYSAAPTGTCDAPGASATDKIVKFFAYSPDSADGVMRRTLSQNFDGRGERFLPGVCTACHDGDINLIRDFGPIDPISRGTRILSNILATSADFDATFMPWDLDSLLYAQAADVARVDPSLNAGEFSAAQLDAASFESQQDDLRSMNEAVLATYLPAAGASALERTETLERFEAPIRLIHRWYGTTTIPEAEAIDDPSNTPEVITDLGTNDFSEPPTAPVGWAGEDDLYQNVFARNCRMCHTQQNNLNLNFDTYNEFIGVGPMEDGGDYVSGGTLEQYVFQRGIMPAARLTYDRFWVDFNDDESAAEKLRTHIGGLGMSPMEPAGTPGNPAAVVRVANGANTFDSIGAVSMISEINADDNNGFLIPTTITLDGSASSFADTFQWTVSTTGTECPSSLALFGSQSAQVSFLVDSSPCRFDVSLEIQATSGAMDTNSSLVFASNLLPEPRDFTASNAAYVPGDSRLDINVLDEIIPGRSAVGNFGDLALTLATAEPNVEPIAPNPGTGEFQISFPALVGVSSTFDYQIIDANMDSANGMITVNIPPILVTPIVESVIGTTPTIKWTVPTSFVADSYSLERDGPVFDGFATVLGCDPSPPACTNDPLSTCSCIDTAGIMTGAAYRYRVVTNLGAETATSAEINVSTLAVPQSVVAAQAGPQVDVTWGPGGAVTPTGYRITRENIDFATSEMPVTVGATLPLSYNDLTIEQNSEYRYAVLQFDGSGESSLSFSNTVVTDVGAPSSLFATASSGTTDTIEVSFESPEFGTDPIDDFGYTLERQLGAGVFSLISRTLTPAGSNPTTYSFADAGLPSDTEYTYRVTSNGRNGSTAATTSNTERTNVSFVADIEPLSTGANPNDGFTANCSGCHSPAQFKIYVRRGSETSSGCLINDELNIYNIGDCSEQYSNLAMRGFEVSPNMRDILLRWQAGGQLD
jgi:hypothetical protein